MLKTITESILETVMGNSPKERKIYSKLKIFLLLFLVVGIIVGYIIGTIILG